MRVPPGRRTSLALLLVVTGAALPCWAKTPPLTGKWVGSGVIYDLASGHVERFTASDGHPESGQLSPDGRWLAVVAALQWPADATAERQVEIRAHDSPVGATPTILLRAPGSCFATWSADSRFLTVTNYAYRDGGFRTSVYLFQPGKLRHWKLPLEHGWLAPACDRVLDLESTEGGKTLIHQRALGGQPIGDALTVPADVQASRFSPDGKRLAYTNERYDLAVWDLAARREQRLSDTRASEKASFWSPDGRWVAAWVVKGVDDFGRFVLWDTISKKTRAVRLAGVQGLEMYDGSAVQWWSPADGAAPDCEPAVQAALGPGEKTPLPLHQIR
jgi:hypothetical protein